MQVENKQKKRKLVLYDGLELKSRDENCTIWTGKKGVYVCKKSNDIKSN